MVLKIVVRDGRILLHVDTLSFLRVSAGLGLIIGTSCSGLNGNIPLFPDNNVRNSGKNSGVRRESPKDVTFRNIQHRKRESHLRAGILLPYWFYLG